MDEVKWIKVVTDIFSNPKIKQIESMPSGPSLVLMWLKMLCLCGARNQGARLMLTDMMPYDEDMLAVEFGLLPKTVKFGISLFEGFGMIERADGAIEIASWEKYQSEDKLELIREQTRLRVAKCRERRRLASSNVTSNGDSSVTRNATDGVTPSVTVTPIEEEEELDIDIHSITLTAHACAVQGEKAGVLDRDQKNFSEKESAHGVDVTICSHDPLQKKRLQQTYLGGTLGQGLVMINAEQFEDLCERLSHAELEKYFKIVTDCEKRGHSYRKKTHYQAILDMVDADRGVRKE